MAIQFLRELEKIKKTLLSLGAMVEDRVQMAAAAIHERNADIAEQIIKLDYEIDEMEVEIEEECLKALALHQPVAVDLRFIIAVIKINNELESIGDQAVNIAQRVEVIARQDEYTHEGVFDYTSMVEKAQFMLKQSLDAFVNLNIDTAFKVLFLDDEVDSLKHDAYDQIKKAISEHPVDVGPLINLLLISRHLERLADHATNIAEEVIYLIEGEIVRHGNL